MKRSRPLSLFLSFIILISCFSVSVSAVYSENLIDSDLRNWNNMNPDFSIVTKTHSVNGNYAYYINTKPEAIADTGSYLKYSMIYSITDFVSGDSYTFNFDLLSLEQAQVYNKNLSQNAMFHGILNNGGKLIVGLGSYNSTIDNVDMIEDASLVINKDNYLQYFGKSNKITFEIPNIVNPCVFITYMEVTSSAGAVSTYLFFDNVSLVNNSDVKEQNFLNKLFAWFQEKFDSIGDSFTNLGNKLTELKNSFLDSLSNLGDTIGSFFDEQLEGIKEFFRGFGNLILYFNWEGEYTNPFEREDSPIDKVSEFFDNLIEYVDGIGTSIENVLDSITGGLHIFDEFTSRFPWLKGIAVFCLALIVITRFIGL